MKKPYFFTFILIFISFFAFISCGYFISSIILKSFSNKEIKTMEISEQNFYAIYTMKTKNKEELASESNDLKSKNGAGFIYLKNNNFYLITSIYKNLNDAELVRNNLKNNNVQIEILTIELPKTTISGSFKIEEKEILSKALKSKYEIFNDLYDISISLDSNLKTLEKIKLSCNNVYAKLFSIKTNLETLKFKYKKNTELSNLMKDINKYYNFLSNLIEEKYSYKTQTYSSLIKEIYCNILIN